MLIYQRVAKLVYNFNKYGLWKTCKIPLAKTTENLICGYKVREFPGSPWNSLGDLVNNMGLSENSVPLHPMVNDDYPY